MGDVFYIAGPVLVVLALALSALGLLSDRFPSAAVMRIALPVFSLVVIVTAVTAVSNAREEQEHRRMENEEASREAEDQVAEEEAAEGPERTGEAEDQVAEEEADGEADGAAPEADLGLGETVFADSGCGSCHTLEAAGTTGTIGPALDETLQGQDAAFVRESIVDPDAVVAEGFSAGTMPSNYGDTLDEDQLDALVAFLVASAGPSN